MAKKNITVKDINGNIIITDGKSIKEWKDEAELDETAVENTDSMKLVVLDEDRSANFCTECGSRNIYCVRESDNAYQFVCRDCGHRIGFRTKQDIEKAKNEKVAE